MRCLPLTVLCNQQAFFVLLLRDHTTVMLGLCGCGATQWLSREDEFVSRKVCKIFRNPRGGSLLEAESLCRGNPSQWHFGYCQSDSACRRRLMPGATQVTVKLSNEFAFYVLQHLHILGQNSGNILGASHSLFSGQCLYDFGDLCHNSVVHKLGTTEMGYWKAECKWNH